MRPLARHTRLPFKHIDSRTAKFFQLLHIDVWGPYHVPTVGGNKSFLITVDDRFRMTWVFLLKLKSDVIIVLKSFFIMV